MADKDVRRGIAYEKKKANDHGAEHVGGPGREDYRYGTVKGEVKNRKRKVTKPELQELVRKGIGEVESKSGFTKPAIDYRDRYHPDITLFQKGKKIQGGQN